MTDIKLMDLMIDKKYSKIDDMMDDMVAKKIFDKIQNHKETFLKNNGSFNSGTGDGDNDA